MVVNPGETITLVCVASGGDPRPTLTWVRPGGEDLPRRSVVNGGTLTIPAVTVEEGGAYTCLASNHVGSPVKKSVSVLVRGTVGVGLCPSSSPHTYTNGVISVCKKDSENYSVYLESLYQPAIKTGRQI